MIQHDSYQKHDRVHQAKINEYKKQKQVLNNQIPVFRCVLASLYEGVTVRPSVGPLVRWYVGPSVRPSVRLSVTTPVQKPRFSAVFGHGDILH